MPDRSDILPFQLDHITARQHGGSSTLSNLAWTCAHCNLHKGPNLTGIDPLTGIVVPLFNPRSDAWVDHFTWSGGIALGLTPTGRATVRTLAFNDDVLLAQ